MSDEDDRKIIPPGGGFFNDLAIRVKLVMRLIGDRRVNPLLKLLPIGSLLYLIIPDPAIGPIDDVLVIWLGSYLFVELCPPQVVAEHRQELEASASASKGSERPSDEVIEGEFWEKRD